MLSIFLSTLSLTFLTYYFSTLFFLTLSLLARIIYITIDLFILVSRLFT